MADSNEGHESSARSMIESAYPLRDGVAHAEILPVTKVPALDTIDQYAVSKSIQNSAAKSPWAELFCSAEGHDLADDIAQGYARFISNFTGLEDVAFLVARDDAFRSASEPAREVICASVFWSESEDEQRPEGFSSCTIRKVDAQHYNSDEVQFSMDLGLNSEPENGEKQDLSLQENNFTLCIEPTTNKDTVRVGFAYPRRLIPDAAVHHVLKALVSQLADSSKFLAVETSPPELSIINFPPFMIPPSLDTHQNGDAEPRGSQPSLLHAAFEGWAQRKPNAIALDFVHSLPSATSGAEHSILTYAALNTAASNLAAHIRAVLSGENKADYGRIIPVYMSTSPELYISYLGVLKAGCAFSPIPQDAPAQRVQEILEDIASPIILGNVPEPASGHWRTDTTGAEANHTWVDVAEISKWKELSGDQVPSVASDESLGQFDIQDDQVAYLLFTSGSTGKPKGVQVSHLAVTCSIESHATAIPLPGDSVGDFRWFQFASPTFDPSLMEIFVTLSSGATLCSADRSLTLTDLEGTINEARATVMMATPSLAALLRPSHLTTLKSLWTMGEKLNRTVIENFSAKPSVNGANGSAEPSTMLVNAYGPTEGAINCTFLAPFDYSIRGSIIGEALPTCAMFVLDPNSHTPKPVPSGLTGELAIGGPQVSKGYLNRPKETAKSFVHSPEFGYVYRTGDMARIVWDETGKQVIEFLGRITSDQVKISGRRLELSEVESVLATVSGVTEVVAVVSKRDTNVQGSEQIVACFVADDMSETAKQKIVREAHATTHRHLSSYMCPSAYTFFPSLPRSSSGKVDRKAISARLQQGEASGVTLFTAPKSADVNGVHGDWESTDDEDLLSLRELVVRLISETTEEDVSVVKAGTDLYSLGVDSLGAMRLLQKLRDHSIEGLSVEDVLGSGTPQALVSIIADHRQANGDANNNSSNEALNQSLESFADRNRTVCAERLGLSPDTVQNVLPTTATQSGMLTSFLRSSADKSFSNRSYIYHSVLPLEPHVDLDRVKAAWQDVIANYDSFRTVFCWLDDDMAPFAQCILADGAVSDADWSIYTVPADGTLDEEATLNTALRNAEDNINLSTPPWKLSIVTSPERTVSVLSMFHGIFDGGSLQLLLEDVSSVYSGTPLAQRTSLEHIVKHHFGADHETTSLFWEKHLQGYSPVVFPSVTPCRAPSVKTTDRVEIIAPTSYDSLKKQSKSIGSTPLSVLQAAWASVLLAYTGTADQDVVMGSVVSGRLDPESETCIGPTFTTVPIRLAVNQVPKDTGDIWTNRSIARYLTSINAKTLSHLQPRLGSLVTADGRLPYDTLLAYQDFNAGSSSSGLWSSIDHPPMANDFAVMVEVWPGADSSLTFRASFNHAQLDAQAAENMLRQMADIVTYILGQPDGNFQDASSNTQLDLKSSFNPGASVVQEALDGDLLHSRFEDHAESHPDDLALIFKGDLDDEGSPRNISWTYAELNAIADNLAEHLLQKCGPLTNSPVPICIEKSPALYVAILGILKAGGAWCPIDTLSPAQRRHDLIARTAASIVLVSTADGAQPEGSIPVGVDVVDVHQFSEIKSIKTTGLKRDSTRQRTSPDGMAYLIWTSGTTGAPKGVLIKHSAGVSAMKSLHRDIPTEIKGGVVRCMQFSQYTFDVSIQDIFYTWGVGGVLISASREIMLGSFPRLANLTKATHAHLTPAFSAGIPRKSCETLEVITMIGEKLTQPVADDWGTDMRAFNTYGPAEVTIVSTIREFGNEHKNVKSANIGWPMDTVSVFVTKNRRMVMKNAVGELALGGPQLSPGYLNQDDVTKAKYVWSEEVSQTLYYTGDLVRMLADGSLEYINRVDDLVKLGGIRVELSEISFSLGECHSLVENIETLILSREDRPTEVVVAFLSAPGAATSEQGDELLLLNDKALEVARSASDQAQSVLPDHMIPSVYLVVKNIPRTPSAKTDRRALQAAYAAVDIDSWEGQMNPENMAFGQSSEDQVNATTAAQIVDMISSLANISSSIITKVSRLGSLGIDSIRAIRLASRLKEAGYQLSVVEVLNCVTVLDLVKLVSGSASEDKAINDVFDLNGFDNAWHSATAAKIKDDFVTVRATTLQESLLSETMGSYNMYWSNHFFSLDRSVDVSRLKQAWYSVCQKTEALRTGFIPVAEIQNDNTPDALDFSMLQLIYKLPAVDWEHIECTEQDWIELRDSRIERIMTAHQSSYFRQPPWAASVFDKGNERILILTIHHSIHDGPSLGLIMNDLRSAYTYKPPSRHQLSHALSIILPTEKRCNETRSFWESELEMFSELDVPVWPDLTGKRIQPGAVQEHHFIAEDFPLTEPVARLQSAAAQLGVSSIASIVRAAWGYVSVGYLGIPATVFAETLSDRVLHSDLEDGVGPLISVVPIPFHPKGSARELLTEQHRLSVQSWKHRHIHARDVRKMLKRPRGEPLYPAVFNFHVASERPKSTSQPQIWRELDDQIGLHVEHPMAMNVFQHANGSLVLEASSDNCLMNKHQLSVFVRQIDGVVSAMLAHPDKPLADLVNYLPTDLRSVSTRPVSKMVADSVHLSPTHWLEANAREHPEWTAVEVANSISSAGIEKELMSYGTLNAEANRVAAFIASFGHKNRMIGLCSGRNIPSYPVMIGIFKSGNTYLPIDEGLPADRKAFLIEDGDCPIVFTERSFSSSFSRVPETCLVICIDEPEFQDTVQTMPSDDRDYQSHPDDLSYLLFTSGSTGKPKGVMVTRGNLSSFIESISEFAVDVAPDTLKLGGTGRYLAQASRAFDPHLLEMLFPWRHGMATATAPRTMILDDLQVTLSQWEITHASFVPSLVDQANIQPELCPKLRFMTVGGEKISQRVLDTWATSHIALVNAYGPTEATIGCTFAHVGRDTNLRNIGPPLTACVGHVLIPGTQTYALRGQTGELCFSGDLVAKGYLNRPDATGFVVGPNGEKMYRTGDIGRLMADDSVEYLGRGDDQTKIRGQRLELGEVSEVLRSSSAVGIDVVTTVSKHPGLAKVQLISFIARSDGRQRQKGGEVAFVLSDFATLGKELQDICKKKLPGYMVPELILPITYIPLAPLSGKASVNDLNALFASLPLSAVLQGNSAASKNGAALTRPLTSEEQAVVKEVCTVISTDSSIIGPMTNIFEIGLDSLSAIGLSIKLRKIGYEATVALVMSNPVIEQLARLPRKSSSQNAQEGALKMQQTITDMESQFHQTPPAGVDLSTVVSVLPCLPLQEGLVARSINNEGDQLYINHVVLQLESHVDAAQLKSAWQTAAKDNEIMRTAFVSLEKEMAQVIFSAASHPLSWDEEEYESLDKSLHKQGAQQGQISRDIISNISRLPPVRFRLAKSTNGQPLALFIAIHHALYDGESFSMLMEDVAARYAGSAVPERGAPSDFIKHVYAQDSDKAKQHWVQTLDECRPTLFRTDTNSMEQPKTLHKSLRNKLSELERRSASLQTTVPSFIQAIFALLLADTVGVSDVTYGLVLSGRAVAAPGAGSVLLPCITTVPGRLNTNELNTVTEVVETVQKSTVKSLDFQHTSLRHIQRWLKSESPLFDCLFSYIRTTAPPNHNLWQELDSQMPAEYPLALEVEANHAADTITFNCVFSSVFSSLYNAEEFLEKMDAVLSSVVSGESLSLENFNLPQSDAPGSRSFAVKWDETSWSTTEGKIRDITVDFCGLIIADVSKGASFISLGIDSVTAIQFSRKLREAGLQASSSDVMRFSCVGALAKHIEQTSDEKPQLNGVNGTTSTSVDVYQERARLLNEEDSISAVFECTPLQSGMISQTLGSAGQVYVHPHPVRLAESVDSARLKDAVFQVIQGNEILRTSFHLIAELGHSWIGAVHAHPPFEWKEVDLPSDVDALSEVSGMFSFSEESSFETPPIRSVLVNQPEGRLLVIIMHHGLYDGASLPFFFEDLATIYSGGSISERPQFSETVKHVLNGQEKSSKYWTQKLLGYEVAEVPQLPASESNDRMFISEHRVDLDLSAVIESCKAMEVTVQSIALLAYSKVLARLIGKRDVVFGQVLAGRSLPTPGAERTVGPLFNTVAQRVAFEPKFLSNKSMAQRVQQMTADAQVHQHAPLRTVQNSLRQANQLNSSSLFDTLFVFQKSADFAGSILETQEIWKPYEVQEYAAQAEYKLNVEVDHGKDGIVVFATSNGQYISQTALNGFLGDFGAVFRDIIEHPTRCATVVPESLGDLPLRLSLPEPEEKPEDSESPPHEPIVQSVLADIAGVSIDNIQPSTSIFSIGLDSLSAIRIASICRSKGLKTGVADILQGNTLRGISQRVRPMSEQTVKPHGSLFKDYEHAEKTVVEKLGLQKESIETILPCLGGQFYHLISWLKSGRKLFEPAWPYFSSERIDSERLQEAWYQLRQRHPVLRTCFAAISSSEAVQVVMKEAVRDTETFKVVNSSTSIAEAAQAQAKEEALHPSSLFVPPVRLRLLKASDRDGILVLVNHAAYDAWTMPMFASELEDLYRGQPFNTNPDFPSFVDYSIRNLRDLDEKAYWSSAVGSGGPTLIKNSGHEAGQIPDQVFVGAWEKVKNVSQLESTCRSAGVSLQTVVLLAVARCLARTTGVQSPTMGLYQTGRSASFTDIEKLSGPCLNVNPFTVTDAISENDTSILNKARAVQSSLAERVSYEQSSLFDVLRWAAAAETPLFNTWVNLLWMQNGVPSANDTTPDAEVTSEDLFLPLRIGVPTDFIPDHPLPGLESTSVSALDTSVLPDENVYIDIGPDPKTDTIGFGVRVEGGLLAEEDVNVLVGDIAGEIEAIVSSLSG